MTKLLPFLAAVFTVTSLYAANAERLGPGQMVYPLLFALLIAGVFSLIFWLNRWTTKTWPFAATFFTMTILAWYLMPWWAGCLLLAGVLFVSIRPVLLRLVNFSTMYIAVNLVIAISLSVIQASIVNLSNQADGSQQILAAPTSDKPNIYFIVPDRMPSIDAMKESGIEADMFATTLRGMGFYVKDNQLSADAYTPNYGKVYTTRTRRFFASALNGGVDIPLDISYKDCRRMIKQPSLFNELHAAGYTIINIGPRWEETASIPAADINLKYDGGTFLDRVFQNELCIAYWNRTIFYGLNIGAYESDNMLGQVERNWHEWQAEQVVNTARRNPANTFIMCHLLLPHEPFVWTAEGQAQAADVGLQEGYYQQIEYAQMYLSKLASQIISIDPNAIIIIQADEGMAYAEDEELSGALSNTQWNGVLTAWRLPDGVNYETIKHTQILKEVTK